MCVCVWNVCVSVCGVSVCVACVCECVWCVSVRVCGVPECALPQGMEVCSHCHSYFKAIELQKCLIFLSLR